MTRRKIVISLTERELDYLKAHIFDLHPIGQCNLQSFDLESFYHRLKSAFDKAGRKGK